MKYKLKIKTKLNKITNKRNLGVLNKFLKGVIIINTNPIILPIKNRGYRTMLVQKLFIKIIIIKSFYLLLYRTFNRNYVNKKISSIMLLKMLLCNYSIRLCSSVVRAGDS